MNKKKYLWITAGCVMLLLICGMITLFSLSWGFAREIPEAEKALRMQVVETAESWLGCRESDGTHKSIIDLYNSHSPLARGYAVTYEDAWCAAFDSAVAIQCGLTEIIPTECGCTPQIELFQQLGCWEEDDGYRPLPGDYIFYHWDCLCFGDCTARADHVGIVVGTFGPFIRVIEGNKDNMVAYRTVLRNAPGIRGYGLPAYGQASGAMDA